jgi:hypothetical protein
MEDSKKKRAENAFKVDLLIKEGDKREIFIDTWVDHVNNRDIIKCYCTIIKDELKFFSSNNDGVFIPFSEFYGDHTENWIILIDLKTNKELFRKNIKNVDLIEWQLSSSQTNLSKDGKQN